MEKTIQYDANEEKLKGLFTYLKSHDRRLIIRAKKKDSCLTVLGNTVTGTVLAATEICGFLCMRYDVTPPNH